MNTAEVTNTIAQTKDIETMTIAPFDTPPKPAPGVTRGTRLHSGWLLGIALLSAWLAITQLNSINKLDATLDKIQANLLLPSR